MSAVYSLIRSCYATPTPIWPSVKYELQTFRNLMIFIASPWRLPRCSMVTFTDSSLFGFGATRATWPIEVVKKFGRVTDRLRFKKMPQGSSRTKALVQAGVYKMAVKDVDSKAEHEWVQDMTYEEIRQRTFAGRSGLSHSKDVGRIQKIFQCWRFLQFSMRFLVFLNFHMCTVTV